MHEEQQYLDLIQQVIAEGTDEVGRNGATRSIFGATMRFSLSGNRLPLLTTKKVAWKTCLKELLWFISGSTDNNVLKAQGVHIWDGNSSREFLDARGLTDYAEGQLGPIYGHQWRNFGGTADRVGVDQLAAVIDQLRNDPTSRRIVMSAWNPQQLPAMALPPCHVLCQFHITKSSDGEPGHLSCAMYQRSCDLALGVPFNIASYSILTHLLARHCGLVADKLVYNMGNVHLYADHIEPIRAQLVLEPRPFPTLRIADQRPDIGDYTVADFVVVGYESHETIKFEMHA